ncbi:hypothetical protein [Nocardioides zeicaulis]|uniref:DUF4395 domain-containing protein n=1 Tax=Nocardioides zeicaulis TaxID=1776857 RepID=A0ABV6DWT8_9ACTN
MQRERVRTPYPWTWEIPAAVTCLVLTGLVSGIQVARTLANLAYGAGLTWPAAQQAADGAAASPIPTPSPVGAAFWTSLPGIVAGNAAAGLPQPVPPGLAPPWLVWVSLALTELLILGATTWACVQCHLRWGPGRMRGMASRAEAEQLLGLRRIRRVASLVRPDLYGRSAARRRPPPRSVAGQVDQPDRGPVRTEAATGTQVHPPPSDQGDDRLTSWLGRRTREEVR